MKALSALVTSFWLAVAAATLQAQDMLQDMPETVVQEAARENLQAAQAPQGSEIKSLWHLGRVTGDLDRIITFYHDVLGLGLRGDRQQALGFYSVPSINEFVNAPPQAEFRAAVMPIGGAANAGDGARLPYLEAFEYRNIARQQLIPAITDIGVSSLRFIVRDLDSALAAVKASGAAFISGDAVAVPVPPGYTGSARAVLVRDPDGYPVELVQITPAPPTLAAADSAVLNAQMTVVVNNLDQALVFYRRFLGTDLAISAAGPWRQNDGFTAVRQLSNQVRYRSGDLLLPASAVRLQFVQYRGVEQQRYMPLFQDIGFGHVAFQVSNIELMLERVRERGLATLSRSGSWTQINDTTRAIYTRDPQGFFIEMVENR